MMADLTTPLSRLIDARAAKALSSKRGLETAEDLLWFLPRRYLDRKADLDRLQLGDSVVFVGEVVGAQTRVMRQRRQRMLIATVASGDHEIEVTFFRAHGHDRRLVPGAQGVFAGQVGRYGGRWQLTHPAYEIFEEEDGAEPTLDAGAGVYPVYLEVPGVPSFTLSRLVEQVLLRLESPPEVVPAEVAQGRGLLPFLESMRLVHRPMVHADHARGMRALKFTEAFVLQTFLARRRREQKGAVAVPRRASEHSVLDRFDERMPFRLTEGQRAVSEEIFADLARPHPMNRLLQGEVGSGKTVVAVRAMLAVVGAGGQAALLAPTEVLATQHHRSVTALLGDLAQGGLLGSTEDATRVALLTGSLSSAERRAALLEAASGQAGIVIGTHALIQEQVRFADLGLVVVDEQHRFGVEQRDLLRTKASGGKSPHVLVMTATPIPRTVAMTVFGDMDTSVLDQLPAGRAPITTHVVDNPRWYERIWERVAEEIAAGRQAYVVCPRIGQDGTAASSPDGEEGPEDQLEERPDEASAGSDAADPEEGPRSPMRGVLEVVEELRAHPALAGARIEVLHGRLPAETKDAVMSDFGAGRVDVLVATTVVEVGVDVPNATVMVILDADRFGVSQLHQLRGRVGRGAAAGLCLLVSADPPPTAQERLLAVAGTTDGFELSRLDLQQRREGDVLGSRQAGGRSSLRVLRVRTDEVIITEAREDAVALVARDPELTGCPGLARAVAQLVDAERAAYLEKG